MWRNSAFSAPSNCIVDDGIRASLDKLPAAATNLTANWLPTTSTIEGIIIGSCLSIYYDRNLA